MCVDLGVEMGREDGFRGDTVGVLRLVLEMAFRFAVVVVVGVCSRMGVSIREKCLLL